MEALKIGNRVVVQDVNSRWHGCYGTVVAIPAVPPELDPWVWIAVLLDRGTTRTFCSTELEFVTETPPAESALRWENAAKDAVVVQDFLPQVNQRLLAANNIDTLLACCAAVIQVLRDQGSVK